MATAHVGDCSTGCDECALACARADHDGCIGTPTERDYGDDLRDAYENSHCRECGAEYDGYGDGDGYDGLCPECAGQGRA